MGNGADEGACGWGGCGFDDFSRFEDVTVLSIYDTTDAAGFGIDDLSFELRDE